MNWILRALVRGAAKTESGRIKLYEIIHEETREYYYEANNMTNLYNATIEFVEASGLNTPNFHEAVRQTVAEGAVDARLLTQSNKK